MDMEPLQELYGNCTPVGVIGVGNMGGGIARNLLNAGYPVTVFDRNPELVVELASFGARCAANLSELVISVDIVITSLPGPAEIEEVALKESGILATARAGLIWIECSTNDPATWKRILTKARTKAIDLVDAPVTGGGEGARNGTLSILMGGREEICAAVLPLLGAFGKNIYYLGPPGAGYAAKLCQLHLNYLVVMGIGEALMLGARADLDLDTLYEMLRNSCAQSYVVDQYIPHLLAGDYDPSFSLGLAEKDLRLIESLAETMQVPLELGSVVARAYVDARERYGGSVPHLSVLRRIEERHRLYLRSRGMQRLGEKAAGNQEESYYHRDAPDVRGASGDWRRV